ncbi:MAG: tryptophanyl-tRNA synthetase, tryptophanyl-tRNA synthetase [Candidatus Parcubacteria bacterium]
MASAKKPVIVSGIQPSGKLHVGNYAGAVRNWIELQDSKKYDCYFFIADYHSITEDYDPGEKRRQVMDLAVDLLALGIDPQKCTFFVQSDVQEHTELAWIFNTVTPVSFLERMTQFKDKAGRQEKNVNMGLFDYPVLQAADILIYKGELVPVGQDQIQHVELTRDIARFFNNKYGAFFPETKPKVTDTPKLLSLTDPLKKMSKSLGEKSFIALSDAPATVADKLKRAVTETTGILPFDSAEFLNGNVFDLVAKDAGRSDEERKGYAGVWNLLAMLRLFGPAHEADRMFAGQPMKYGDLKKLVAQRIAEYFVPFREKRAALAENPGEVRRMLDHGAAKASVVAKKTMEAVRQAIGVR